MGKHVAFQGGWDNVGKTAATRGAFKPEDTFALELEIDVAKHTATAEINGTEFTVTLPADLETVRYIGVYNKATATDFTSPIVVVSESR